MNTVDNFRWDFDSTTAAWFFNGKKIEKKYHLPVRSAVMLRDQTGVAVVEPFEESGRTNAVVFNADGTERFRLAFPLPEPHGHCFDQMYYVNNVLTAFANLGGNDFGYVLDEQTGNVVKSFESR